MMNSLSSRRFTGFYLLVLVQFLTPARCAYSEATLPGLQQSTGGPVPVIEAGAATDGEGARVAGPVSPSRPSVTGKGVREVDDTRENLTGFFVIGMIINVLLFTLFLIWAVGQWRKTKK